MLDGYGDAEHDQITDAHTHTHTHMHQDMFG